jgi:hypothetical protein
MDGASAGPGANNVGGYYDAADVVYAVPAVDGSGAGASAGAGSTGGYYDADDAASISVGQGAVGVSTVYVDNGEYYDAANMMPPRNDFHTDPVLGNATMREYATPFEDELPRGEEGAEANGYLEASVEQPQLYDNGEVPGASGTANGYLEASVEQPQLYDNGEVPGASDRQDWC